MGKLICMSNGKLMNEERASNVLKQYYGKETCRLDSPDIMDAMEYAIQYMEERKDGGYLYEDD